MKKIYQIILTSCLVSAGVSAQPCATATVNGSASNVFTNIRNATNCIAVDNDINTVVFVHRNNASAFGGSSGNLRYDMSTDGGTTWTNNQGVLNPLMTNAARYPQVAIYNPVGNTTANNAYLSYLAPTIVGSAFIGNVSGVRQLNGTGTTENYNQPAATQTLIPNSMVKGAPGIFWSIDAVYNGSATTGFRIFKGVWNGSNDVIWSTNATLTPSFNTAYSGVAQVGDFHIAFDPTGQIGWVSILTHLTGGPTPYAFYPVFYKTTDGGNTWSAPIQVDLGQFNCINANITVGNFASTAFESDLVVDVNGEPHLFTTVCNGNNAYAVFFASWHHMYDITNHFGLWNAIDVANVNAGRGTFGISPNTATMDNAPMASRTDDGTKVFFAWSDNSTYTTGASNLTPNIFSKAYDVNTHMWTAVRDFTSCNVATNGSAFFPKLASEVLEPSSGQYKLAAIVATMTSNDPALVANFRFLDNMTWANADFTTPQVFATVAVDQGATWLLCPGSTQTLSVTGSFNQVLWSDGATTLTTTINTPGVYTIAVRAGCTVGIDTITVIGVADTITAATPAICPGDSTLLTVSGNALSYSWSPISSTNDSVIVTPSASTTYTLTAGGDGGCTYTLTSSVTVHPQPVLTTTASAPTICIGDSSSLSTSGAVSYVWQPGNDSVNAITVIPVTTSTYSVTGIDVNGCIALDSITVNVNQLPTVLATADTTVLCLGDTAMLSGNGASSYAWTPSASLGSPSASTTSAYPTSPTDYIVMGTDSNGCMNVDTISIWVNMLPVVTTTQSGTLCENDTAFFSASGASTYLWMPLNQTGANVYDFPVVGANNYYVTGIDSNGCSAIDSFIVTVNPLPDVTANGQTPLCAGSSTTLNASGASTYLWLPQNSTSNPTIETPSATTTYTVVGTTTFGCSDSAFFTVVVNPLPVVSLSITSSSVCVDDGTLSLSGTGSPSGGTFSGNGVVGSNFSPVTAGLGSQTITYVYVDSSGCSDTATDVISVNACVGINEVGSVISTIYPNPFGGQVILETTGTGKTQLVVHTLLGQEIMNTEFTGSKLTVETATWPAGVYIFTVTTAEGQQTARLVKE